jgi:Predicted SPOUT methyltransferase
MGAPMATAMCCARANKLVSFGQLTIAHRLVRLLALEQIYRGFRILRGEPYHRDQPRYARAMRLRLLEIAARDWDVAWSQPAVGATRDAALWDDVPAGARRVLAVPYDQTTMYHVGRLQVFERDGALRFRVVVCRERELAAKDRS